MNDWERPLDHLLPKLVDDGLTREEQTELNHLLALHAGARESYRQYLEIHSGLDQHLGAPKFSALEGILTYAIEPQAERRIPVAWRDWRWLAAAALLILMASLFLFRPPRDSSIARITEMHGPVQWTGQNGLVEAALGIDRLLGAGTLETLSEDSWITFQYLDGSEVTLSGRCLLSISEFPQKIVRVRSGVLSAVVAPQPAGHPMWIQTPTAELEVLGTRFNLDAGPSATVLGVNEGRVRFKQLSDGQTVEVPAGYQVRSMIDDPASLQVSQRDQVTRAWRGDLAADTRYGKWVDDLTMLALRLKKAVAAGEMPEEEAHRAYQAAADLGDNSGSVWAVPWIVQRGKAGNDSALMHLITLSITRRAAQPVLLSKEAKFLIQGRVQAPAEVFFGFTVNARGGGFAGKYEIARRFDDAGSRGKHIFRMEIPLAEFQAVPSPDEAKMPFGKELVDWWSYTTRKEAALEITRVELLAPP